MTWYWSLHTASEQMEFSIESKIILDIMKIFSAIVLFIMFAKNKLTSLVERVVQFCVAIYLALAIWFLILRSRETRSYYYKPSNHDFDHDIYSIVHYTCTFFPIFYIKNNCRPYSDNNCCASRCRRSVCLCA